MTFSVTANVHFFVKTCVEHIYMNGVCQLFMHGMRLQCSDTVAWASGRSKCGCQIEGSTYKWWLITETELQSCLCCTGFERPSASSSNWRSSCTELFTALHLSTYRASFSTSLICRQDVEAGCARRPPVCLTSVRRDLLLSAIVRLLLPARDSGTV